MSSQLLQLKPPEDKNKPSNSIEYSQQTHVTCIFAFIRLEVYIASNRTFTVRTATAVYNITYDANGNRISGFGFYFEYNNFNQLLRVRNSSASGPIIEEYTYDHEGNRIQKYEPQKNQTTYYFDESFIRVVNSSGTSDTVYYYDEKDLVSRKELWNNKTFFYHPDHLGSTSLITNSTGSLVEETSYEPFGEVFSGGNDRFLYTGKELDPNTGLEYYGARYYDPSKASQFISPDSVIADIYNPQALNRYSYVLNNPYKYTDESGNVPEWAVLPIVLAMEYFILPLMEALANPVYLPLVLDSAGKCTSGESCTDLGVSVVAPGAGKAAGTAISKITSGGSGVESTAQKIANQLGPASSRSGGTAKHTIAQQMMQDAKLPNVYTEVSIKGGTVVPYGTSGSIRPDVIQSSQDLSIIGTQINKAQISSVVDYKFIETGTRTSVVSPQWSKSVLQQTGRTPTIVQPQTKQPGLIDSIKNFFRIK